MQELSAFCHKVLPYVTHIGDYTHKDTPFDWFDSECHEKHITSYMKNDGLSDSDLIFMINTAQHVKRPIDMLMFLGEYFKNMI